MPMSVTTRPSAPQALIAPVTAALAVGTVVLALLFLPEGRAAVGVWLASTAYGHCFLVLPMAMYLAWDRRESVRGIAARPTLAYTPLILPVMAAWFVAERLGIMEGRQLAAIGALEVLFLSLLGRRLFTALSGPLLYLFFLVPFGAFITPALQQFTAGFIAVGLHVLGIPAYVTDLTIEISAGTFFVAEACAGLRFLIAAVAFGVFYALLNYRSPKRRVVFIAASVIVPILANGMRALGIVVLGNILGSAEAAAADHIIYGWGFFSVVMLLLVAAGMPWRQHPAEAPAAVPGRASASGAAALWPAVAVCALAAAGPAAAAALNQRIVPAVMAVVPALAAPRGCVAGPETPPTGGVAVRHFRCAEGALTVTLTVLPLHAPPDQLQRERLRLTVPAGADDTSISVLRGVDTGSGQWSLIESREPDLLVAAAVWVGGQPAQGGLAGRITLARDSLLQVTRVPLLMTVAADGPTTMTEVERRRARELVQQFVAAQSGLTAAVAAATRVAADH